jgi:hypothetical protein
MTDATRAKVERTRSYLLASQLPEDTKDGLQTLLDAASIAANGTQDRIGAMADAILALSLHEVRQAVRAPDAVQDAVADAISAHLATCPIAGQGKRGALVALAMKPWPWLFAAVAVFSPHAPRIVEVVAGMAAR